MRSIGDCGCAPAAAANATLDGRNAATRGTGRYTTVDADSRWHAVRNSVAILSNIFAGAAVAGPTAFERFAPVALRALTDTAGFVVLSHGQEQGYGNLELVHFGVLQYVSEVGLYTPALERQIAGQWLGPTTPGLGNWYVDSKNPGSLTSFYRKFFRLRPDRAVALAAPMLTQRATGTRDDQEQPAAGQYVVERHSVQLAALGGHAGVMVLADLIRRDLVDVRAAVAHGDATGGPAADRVRLAVDALGELGAAARDAVPAFAGVFEAGVSPQMNLDGATRDALARIRGG